MTDKTRASSALFGGALPPAGDGHGPAFLFEHPPCANWSRSYADRINAHGYSVARNPNHRWRRRDALYALGFRRAQCYPDIAPTRRTLISD